MKNIESTKPQAYSGRLNLAVNASEPTESKFA